jgi:Right handed beta helix region
MLGVQMNLSVILVFRCSGGTVLCTNCAVSFTDFNFEACTLIVLAGAHVTLHNCSFTEMEASVAGLSVYVSGHASEVGMSECSIEGGVQGVAVKGGACFTAKSVSITDVEVAAVDADGEGTHVALSDCAIGGFVHHEHNADFEDDIDFISRGVYLHNSSSAYLYKLSISGSASVGVDVGSNSTATLLASTFFGTVGPAVRCMRQGAAHLTDCTLSHSWQHFGLSVEGHGSQAQAYSCCFQQNAEGGVIALTGGHVCAVNCTSVLNKGPGFSANGTGSVVQLQWCKSNQDSAGLLAAAGAAVSAVSCHVTKCQEKGIEVCNEGSTMTLQSSTVANGALDGVSVEFGAVLHAENCLFHQNAGAAVRISSGSIAKLRVCAANENHRGYSASATGELELVDSVAERNADDPVSCSNNGVLMLQGVTVVDTHGQSLVMNGPIRNQRFLEYMLTLTQSIF